MDVQSILDGVHQGDPRSIGRAISLIEDNSTQSAAFLGGLNKQRIDDVLVVGLTGPPGAGKSTLTNSLIQHLRSSDVRVGIIAVDPSSPISGGAILGDRIRMMDHAMDVDVVVRSMATRGRLGGLCASAGSAVRIMAASGCRFVIIETVGIGQSEMDIVRLADLTVMVLAPGFGDDIQAMKAGILEVADLLVLNKADKPGIEKMLLDLSTLFHNKEEAGSSILKTVASEHTGIDTLLQQIYKREKKYRQKGLFEEKRKKSFQLEAVDWALELLRNRLLKASDSMSGQEHDPRQAAEALVKNMFSKDT